MVQQNFNQVSNLFFFFNFYFSFPFFCICDWGGMRLGQSLQHASQHMDGQNTPCVCPSWSSEQTSTVHVKKQMSRPNVLMLSKRREISPPASALLALYSPDLLLNQLWYSIKAPPEENNLCFSAPLVSAGLLSSTSSQRDQTPERENRKQGEYIVRSREENPQQGTQTRITTTPQQTGCCVPAGEPRIFCKQAKAVPGF